MKAEEKISVEELLEMGHIKEYAKCTNEDCILDTIEYPSHHPEERPKTCPECGEPVEIRKRLVIENVEERFDRELTDEVAEKFREVKEDGS